MAVKVEGLQEVLRQLNREIGEIESASLKGLLKAGLIVQADAQRTVPVEYGNLRASAYTRRAQKDAKAVEIGFEAAYALFVHENLEQKWKGRPRTSGLGSYWGPKGTPKFLEKALTKNKSVILDLLTKEAKIDGKSR